MNSQVEAYIESKQSPQKEVCQRLRQIILNTFPKVHEEMKWGVPAYDHGNYYIVALKTHVNIGFSIKDLTEEEVQMLKGNGKTMRHIEVFDINEVNEKRIVKLLNAIKKKRQN